MYYGFFHPMITYGVFLWSSAKKQYLNKLISIQQQKPKKYLSNITIIQRQ